MNLLLQDNVQEIHYQELLKEAKRERLARAVAPQDPAWRQLAGRLLLWMGTRSVDLGRRLQAGPAINPKPVSEGCP